VLKAVILDENKRIANRRKVLKAAKIVSLDSYTVSDCGIRNISDTGTQLVVQNQSLIPKEFQFFLSSDNNICNAEVMWRRGNQIGVRFTSEFRRAPAGLTSR
jgi:PilZ domain